MNRILMLLGVSLCLLLSASDCQASIVLDQANDTNLIVTYNGGSGSLEWQQQVTVGVGGILDSVDINFAGSGGEIRFFINKGATWQSDADDVSFTYTTTAGWNSIDVSWAGLEFSAGDKFVIGLDPIDGGFEANFSGTYNSSYAGGDLFLNGNSYVDGQYDLGFRTFMNVPEPTTAVIWSMFAGVGLVARRRRVA